ncbi:MAG: flagellar basal body P-ring protein FlgI [Opitutales bacterium]|nr:flagellar basal body P-ring protein FlgI [Opitutales bacterium]
MIRPYTQFILALCGLLLAASVDASRIKDITTIAGQRDNQLVGYGLVVGLAGDGDSQQAEYTVQTIANMLERFGISVDPNDLRSRNVAAVMVTTDINSFVQPGSRIDVTVSSIGDADSLSGGILLQTPLLGADNNVYAVAQGSLLIGGFAVSGGDGGTGIQRNHPTVARMPRGAIVERGINSQTIKEGTITFLLDNPDYATATLMEEAVNRFFPGAAKAKSAQNLVVSIPEAFRGGSETSFIASVEAIQVETDQTARVVIDERTGTIVATADVRLSPVAVSHGNITVSVATTPVISQPGAFSPGETVEAELTEIEVVEVEGGFSEIIGGPTLSDLTTALNSLGVSSRDMMVILQSIKSAGALHAELIIE